MTHRYTAIGSEPDRRRRTSSEYPVSHPADLLRVIRTYPAAEPLTTCSSADDGGNGGGGRRCRRLGPASPIYGDSANSYANAKAPAACRHCSPFGVPVSLGLTYYANFRKTLTGRTRVIDTHPLAVGGEPVSGCPTHGSTPTGRFKGRKQEERRWKRR